MESILIEKPELKKFYSRCCIPDLSLSPNGKWAVFQNSKKDAGPGLSIVNVDSKKQWDIYYYDITHVLGCDCFVEVVHWSHDGHYVYVSPRMALDGDLSLFLGGNTQLIRINLDNGSWVNTKMGAAFSFSPNDRFIAYRQKQNVVIHEFQTGHERIFAVPTEYVTFGNFVWSPDSKQIIFMSSSVSEVLVADEYLDGKPSGFTIFLLNINSMNVRTVLEKDERYLCPRKWQTQNIVLLESFYKVGTDGTRYPNDEQYKLDLETGSITKTEFQ